MPVCSSCNKTLGRDSFTNKQLKKTSSERRCKTCVSNDENAAAIASMKKVKKTLLADGTLDPRLDAATRSGAMNYPVRKTAPSGFDTVAEAEAAGWKWHPERKVWQDGNMKGSHELKDLEQRLEQYSLENIETLDMTALQEELTKLRSLRPFSPNNTGSSDMDRSDMISEVAALASEIRACARDQRKQKSGAESRNPKLICCSKCLKPAAAGKTMSSCSRCQQAQYCSKECQVDDWPNHKALCRETSKRNTQLEREGVVISQDKQQEVLSWYQQVPNLHSDVVALAWKFRADQPVLRVTGGTNTRIAEVTLLTKDMWRIVPEMKNALALRFSSATFKPDRHFITIIQRSKDPTATVVITRMQFPFSAAMMNTFVAQQDAARRAKDASGALHYAY